MKPTWSIRFLCGIIMQNHHCPQWEKKTKQRLTSLPDSAPFLSSFPSATASHSWESVQVSGPSGPSGHKQTGVEVAEGRPGGSKLYARTSGTPISVCECRTDELLFLLKLSFHDNTPLPPPPSYSLRRQQEGARVAVVRGGHLLILKIWTGISLLSKSVIIHLMDHCPVPSPAPNWNPSTVILFNISSSRRPPKSLSKERSHLADRYVAAAQL